MPSWVTPQEARRYLGVNHERLEALLVEFNIDVEMDEFGEVERIDAEDLKEPLFAIHQELTGYRPDDSVQMRKIEERHAREERSAKLKRQQKRKVLVARVERRAVEARKHDAR